MILDRRESGILLHVTSLPSEHGIGDLGPWAYRFADFLEAGGQRLWQVLPLNPTDPAFANSPYSSPSALAGNPLLISPEILLEEGYLRREEMDPAPAFPRGFVDYEAVTSCKQRLFRLAHARFRQTKEREDFDRYCADHAGWIEDYALFAALRTHFQKRPWNRWPTEIRDRNPEALRQAREQLRDQVEIEKFLQHLFHRQWLALKNTCNRKGIRILGDIPIYVNFDSADVWTHCGLFHLDEEKNPLTVAGVPPDYFSKTGQRWGNPVYRWAVLRETGYAWWVERIRHNLALFDLLRIDHLRGLVAYWEVPATEPTAVNGRWVPGPGDDFFHALFRHFPSSPFIAEDLGTITQDVRELLERFQLPGMKVLLFAFGEELPESPYAPHNHVQNCLIYTGTHDNNTARGWFETEISDEDRERISFYLGRPVGPEEIAGEMVRLAMTSVARIAVFPIQDLLGLGAKARMNQPASVEGNWLWRLHPEAITPDFARRLYELTRISGRI